MTSDERPAGLEELITEVSMAPPEDLVLQYHQKLSAYGTDAIRAITPLLGDDHRRHALAIIIKSIAQKGPDEQATGCEAILTGLRDVRPSGQTFLLDTLDKMGCDIGDPGPFTPGTQFTPIHGGVTAHHAVRDVVRSSGTRFRLLYLVECHWVFSKDFVDRHGGLINNPKGRYCYFCAKTVTGSALI